MVRITRSWPYRDLRPPRHGARRASGRSTRRVPGRWFSKLSGTARKNVADEGPDARFAAYSKDRSFHP